MCVTAKRWRRCRCFQVFARVVMRMSHVYEFDHTCVSPQGGGSDADPSRCFFVCHVTEPRIDEDQSYIYTHTYIHQGGCGDAEAAGASTCESRS